MPTFIHTSLDQNLQLVKGQRGVAGHAVLFFVGGVDVDEPDADERNIDNAYATGCFGRPADNGFAVYALTVDGKQGEAIWHRSLELDAQAFAEIKREFGCGFAEQMGREMTEDDAEKILGDRPNDISDWDPEFREYTSFDAGDAHPECDWAIQGIQARAARRQGYLFVESEDEQGPVFFADFTGRLEIFNEHVRRLI
jgi:hypothetical protein